MTVRSDLLSLPGVFLTAILLALGSEASPGDPAASASSRDGHAALVVLVILSVLFVGDLLFRSLTYHSMAQRRWEITTRPLPGEGGTRLVVRSRDRERYRFPTVTEVCVKTATGPVRSERNDPGIIDGGHADTELGTIELEQLLEPGRHEVRVYARPQQLELIRRTLSVSDPDRGL